MQINAQDTHGLGHDYWWLAATSEEFGMWKTENAIEMTEAELGSLAATNTKTPRDASDEWLGLFTTAQTHCWKD